MRREFLCVVASAVAAHWSASAQRSPLRWNVAAMYSKYSLGVREMPSIMRYCVAAILVATTVTVATCCAALAQKKYDTGASDTEIKIGNIVPYSGPASAYGTVGKAMAAVFRKVNDDGGIHGR